MERLSVLIGKFQFEEIPNSLKKLLIENIIKYSQRLIIIRELPTRVTTSNPLTFLQRKMMLKPYSDKIISWKNEDIKELIQANNPDNLPIDIIELSDNKINIIEDIDSIDFRKGIIRASQLKYPSGQPCIDVVAIQSNQILLARKPNREKFQLIGGFYDPELDKSYEDTVVREFYEETGLIINNPLYLFSLRISKDYRYLNDKDKIISSIYLVHVNDNEVAYPQDDIEELKWFYIDDLVNNYENIIDEVHIELIEKLLNEINL